MVRWRALVRAAIAAAALVSIALLLDPAVFAQASPVGSIRVAVYDADFGVPVAQVRVLVVGTTRSGVTSQDGIASIDRVPPGVYTLSLSKDGYERRILPGVTIVSGQVAEVRAEMSYEIVDLEEFVVTGVQFTADSELAALEVRAAAVNLQDTVSTELIAKAGAGDVAGALKLVVGASVSEGKYATVRGLSDRYTGATLNGVRVPSPDPRRRAVQVDLFPTGTVEAVNVTKTFTPDLQGDFTGGGVDIRTKSIPEGSLLSFSTAVEWNSVATGNEDFLTYVGGGVSATGFGGDERDLPEESTRIPLVPPPPAIRPSDQQTADAEAYDEFARALTPVMGVSRSPAAADQSMSLVGGKRWQFDGGTVLGFLGALTWSRKHDLYDDAIVNTGRVETADSGISVGRPRMETKGTEEVLLGALANLVVRPNDRNEVAFRIVANQGAQDEARFQSMEYGYPSYEQNQGLLYLERSIGSIQSEGTHRFLESEGRSSQDPPVLALNWLASYNFTQQDEPDVRFFRNIYNVETFSGEQPPGVNPYGSSRRLWRTIEEDNVQGGANLTRTFRRWEDRFWQLKAGFYGDDTSRDFTQRSFYFFFPTQLGSPSNPAVAANSRLSRFQGAGPSDLWTDVFLEPERIGLAPNRCAPGGNPFVPSNNCSAANQLLWVPVSSGNDVDYSGDQKLSAAYAMVEIPLVPPLKFIGGVRWEQTTLSIVPVNRVTGLLETLVLRESGAYEINLVDEEDAKANIRDASWLPSLNLVWEIVEKMNLRAAYSKTVARPTFRELAPVATQEFLAGDEFLGNPDLILSKIRNYDLRWEWFRRSGEVFAASIFYKELTDPIEMIGVTASGRDFLQPLNYERGTVRGIELESRLPLGAFAPRLKQFTVGLNYALIDSMVDVPQKEQNSLSPLAMNEAKRRLQGQPSYLANLFVDYDNDRTGTSASVFFNSVGEMLLSGAAAGESGITPNVFEDTVNTVSASFRQKFHGAFTVALKIGNLLGQDRRTFYRTPWGEEAVKTDRETSVIYSLGLGVKW
jgi:TonB-dependent receptor